VPLPALDAARAASQLIWRALGPDPDRVRPVLLWLAGGDQVALEAGFTRNQLSYRIGQTRSVGARTPVPPAITAQLADPNDQWAARVRLLFGLHRPRPDRLIPAEFAHTVAKNAATAERILAAVGPLALDEVWRMVQRTHRYRRHPMPSPEQLAEGLRRRGAHSDGITGLWCSGNGVAVWPRDAALLATADPTAIYSRQELAALLHRAGYPSGTVRHNIIGAHPLIESMGRNQYRVYTAARDRG
jgi:hypothetical protein